MPWLEPRLQQIGDAERIGLDGERGVRAARRGHEGPVGDIEVFELPGAAARVEHGAFGVVAEPRAAEDMVGDAGRRVDRRVYAALSLDGILALPAVAPVTDDPRALLGEHIHQV